MTNETNDVTLRDVTDSDLPILFAQQLDPDAAAMAAFPSRDEGAFMAHMARIRADATNILRAIVFKGQVAGNIGSWEHDGEREVGYWLGKEYWGQGIATQALAAFLGDMTERPLYAHVATHNIGSRRVLEKRGFTIIGEETGSDGIEEFILRLDAPERGGAG